MRLEGVGPDHAEDRLEPRRQSHRCRNRVAQSAGYRSEASICFDAPVAVRVIFLVIGFVPAIIAILVGAVILWRAPERAQAAGAKFADSFATESRRFAWVLASWVVAFLFISSLIATLIALGTLLVYWDSFVGFLRQAFKNEWPYNFLGVLGAAILYYFAGLSSVFANFLISTITGFHPTYFPSAAIIIAAIFMFFAVFVAFTIISGLAALITGFSSGIANRIFPVAFMLSVPLLVSLIRLAGNHGDAVVALAEKIIISFDFNYNARFERGRYAATDGTTKDYGTKVCPDLPFDALIAPHAQGGYIEAVLRICQLHCVRRALRNRRASWRPNMSMSSSIRRNARP
jgi:hypothetical protein